MLIKKVIVEKVCQNSKYVLKRVYTTDGIFLGRQMPITNSLFTCEENRKYYHKSMLQSPFQTCHIHPHKRFNYWMFDEQFYKAKQHAKEQSRKFIPYLQRSKEQLASLTWKLAEDDFFELVNKGTEYNPYVIPESATLQECNKRFLDAESVLSSAQKLIPVLSSNHSVLNFSPIIATFFGRFSIIGVHFTSPGKSNPGAKANLLDLWNLNAQIPAGEESSIIMGFNNLKHYSTTKVSGSFVCSKYGIDVPSQMQMHPDHVKGMMANKENAPSIDEDKDFIYDREEGGFNQAQDQIAWYGKNITQKLLSNITLDEGLERYGSIMWSSFLGQKLDFDAINQAILEKDGIKNLIANRSRWDMYIKKGLEQEE